MTYPAAAIRQSGSFLAGLLIGLSIVAIAFAATDPDSVAWPTLLVVVAPVILLLGLVLQVAVGARPQRRPATSPA